MIFKTYLIFANQPFQFLEPTKTPKPSELRTNGTLSERELEILQLASTGLQNKEIAVKLFISNETVKKHLKNIFSKLEVTNRIEAINKMQLL